MNLKIKFRESFRPFAPAVLREKAADWFDLDRESPYMLLVCQVKELIEQGFAVVATGGTAQYLSEAGLPIERVNKVAEGRRHIVDKIIDGEIALIFNTTEGWQSLKDSKPIRQSALAQRIPYFTTAPAALEAAKAIAAAVREGGGDARLEVRPLQSYYSQSHN